nr:hypothetical protein [uncultured Acetobacter sp.]
MKMTASLADIHELVARFTGPSMTQTLSRIEGMAQGTTAQSSANFLENAGIDRDTLSAAAEMKRLAGQINVTIHALGILLCLPHILETGEKVEYVSLGAGNTGRKFDLETNLRVAEFKFITWRGGAESIRQNGVFKDYFLLAEDPTKKKKHLYLLETKHALKFLQSNRSLSSILSRNNKLHTMFFKRFGETFRTVGEYYAAHSHTVKIDDVSPWLSELTEGLTAT